jgi:hypothetical protein
LDLCGGGGGGGGGGDSNKGLVILSTIFLENGVLRYLDSSLAI